MLKRCEQSMIVVIQDQGKLSGKTKYRLWILTVNYFIRYLIHHSGIQLKA